MCATSVAQVFWGWFVLGEQRDLVRYCLSGVRKHTSVRCDSLLWENFMRVCKVNGWSTCDVLEKLILGFVGGVDAAKPSGVPTLVVQVDAPRIVKRVRRRQLVFEDEVSVSGASVEDEKKLKCYFQGCGRDVVGEAVSVANGMRVLVCEHHREELRNHPKWKVVET